MIIVGTVGRECKCCLIKFELRSKIERDSGAYQEISRGIGRVN